LSREIDGGLYYLTGKEVDYPADEGKRNVNGYSFLTNNKKKAEKFLEVYEKCEYKLEGNENK
jgi:hypothetical protein